MPKKEFVLDDGLAVTIYKRKTSRNLRLTLAANGEVRVSIPAWAPYKAGIDFARTRSDWIRAKSARKSYLYSGQAVGKAHHLEFILKPGAAKPTSRISGGLVKVYLPDNADIQDAVVQKAAEKACVKALRLQAESLLPQRLASLANQHGFSYGQVSIKRLKGRWGSCDQNGNIVLNLFLMQLPWDLIDYVLMHELTHTQVMRHGPSFWQAMADKLPNVTQLRRSIKAHAPIITATT